MALYGPQKWWPAENDWEMAVGSILTQHTSWRNVEKAIKQMTVASCMSALATQQIDQNELIELIKPAGCASVKATRLKALAQWWLANYQHMKMNITDTEKLRQALLNIHGVGPETADCILLYAFNQPTFVIDAYTKRLFCSSQKFMKLTDDQFSGKTSYEKWRLLFLTHLPHSIQLFNEYHALIVTHLKTEPQNYPSLFD